MASIQVGNTCPIDDLCCGINCCDPAIECCDGGSTCEDLTSAFSSNCNSCTHTGIDENCLCILKDNGCTISEYPCGTGCCSLGQICASCAGGIPVCVTP